MMLQSHLSGAQRTRGHYSLSEFVGTANRLSDAARRNDSRKIRQQAEDLCAIVSGWHRSRFLNPKAIDDGLAVSTIVQHRPRKHPPTTEPREFDTLFFTALFLMELAGTSFTFHWLYSGKGRYYLRGKLSAAGGDRFYLTRIVLNARPRHSAHFNEDHHSYRLRDLIQFNGAGSLPDGEHGRQAAIDRCSERYAATRQKYHESLSPDDYRKLLTDLLTTATTFHGKEDTASP